MLVTAADKAHNARDIVFDVTEDPNAWNRFTGKLDGAVWYSWSLRQKLLEKMPQRRSVQLLAEAVEAILERPQVQAKSL